MAGAAEARDAAAAAADAAAGAVEAAVRELAGAEAGDGRDESNRSVQERLADAQTAQVDPPLRVLCTTHACKMQPHRWTLSSVLTPLVT